jgi:hypothetical protein
MSEGETITAAQPPQLAPYPSAASSRACAEAGSYSGEISRCSSGGPSGHHRARYQSGETSAAPCVTSGVCPLPFGFIVKML